MLFPTIEFALFFLIVLGVSWSIYNNPGAHRIFLLVASYIFYGFWNWRYCFLLFILSTAAWFIAKMMMNQTSYHRKRNYLIVGIIFFILVLVYYKYTGLLYEIFQLIASLLTSNFISPIIDNPILPLGISFITFHAISLMFDAYRHALKQTPSLINVLLYVSFFPQLIAGPILRASHFLPQLERPRQADYIRITRAGILISLGLFKKVIIANYLASQLVDDVFSYPENQESALLGVYGYSIQIYCDFSGYTDIAIGCALLLGYQFPLNFRNPYKADSIQDFWHRWHITLSTWLKDYLYIPMGGSRYGLPRTMICLMLTMVVGGLWHGAGWQFLIWGAYHGLLLIIYHLWARWANTKYFSWRQTRIWRTISIVFVFHLVSLGWIFFRSVNLNHAIKLINNIGRELASATVFKGADQLAIIDIVAGLSIQYIPIRARAKIERFIGRRPAWIQGLMLAICISLIEYFGPIGIAPFIYFQF